MSAISTMERPPIPSRRIWLDATQDSDDGGSDATEHPPPLPPIPVPAIPPEHAAAFRTTPNPKRKSAPPGRIRTRVDNAAASPQVMASLLDSFSTLSEPKVEHNRSSPRLSGAKSTPATPVLRHRSSFGQGVSSERTSMTDYEAYRQQLADELEEPEAAEPPVIRTSKRPSGKSEWTAPKVHHESSLSSYVRSMGGRSGSSLSLQRPDDDNKSIGNVSIDSNRRRRSLVSLSRESLDIRLGKKKSLSRVITPTKEEDGYFDRDSVRELVLNATGAPDHFTPPTSPRRRATPYESIREEEPPSPTLDPTMLASLSAVKEGKRPVHVDAANGPAVPSRRSSLRHHDLPASNKNRLSRDVTARSSVVDPLAEEDEPQTKVILSSLDGEPTEVTKRINDLKARKEQREREARLSPSPEPVFSSAQASQISSASPTRPNFPSTEFKSSKHDDKKSRIASLGAIHVTSSSAPGSSSTPSKTGRAGEQLNVNGQLPPTPVTPTQLPINYSYVVQSLSKRDSSSSIHAPGSEKDDKRRPIAVGGRSAVVRATSAKFPLETVESASASENTSRVVSPEPVDGRSSTDMKSGKASRSNSLKLKRRRWSVPEVPTTERSNSMKRADSLAVQPLQRPEKIVEERPSSADSIDLDVKKFIFHPRLSQKIRHPQTGRTIAFSEVGDPKGHVVFCCVGMGLTRYVTAFYDELATTLGLRLITPDRPGVGESPADPNALPLNWPDDVLAICQALRISKFSIMAHSAGAIYALATALRMPQHIRGRVHLLAPWIPPSQMAPIGLTKQDPPPAAQLPKSQRILRAMPAPFLKIANTGFLSAASASLSPNAAGSPRRDRKRKSDKLKRETTEKENVTRSDSKTDRTENASRPSHVRRESIMLMDTQDVPDAALEYAKSNRDLRADFASKNASALSHSHGRDEEPEDLADELERRSIYDSRLTLAIWSLATQNANPAVDLLVCLERQRDIGFMYKDITRSVVIHHGSKDTRVPVDNVRWLGRAMRKCEVRVLEGEGHGLMASARVMGSVLEEMGREWRDWDRLVKGRGEGRRA